RNDKGRRTTSLVRNCARNLRKEPVHQLPPWHLKSATLQMFLLPVSWRLCTDALRSCPTQGSRERASGLVKFVIDTFQVPQVHGLRALAKGRRPSSHLL